MRLARRLFVSILLAATVVGSLPGGLALDCVAYAASAAPPCEHAGCDEPEAPALPCVCIYYPAPQAPGSLAVLAAGPDPLADAATPMLTPAPPAAVPARDCQPDPPPPRRGGREVEAAGWSRGPSNGVGR